MRTAVIIPSYNRPDRLRSCLQSLIAMDPSPDEIVVVDDGSDAPLAPVCAAIDPGILCVRQTNAGPAAARNAGVRATTAPFIALTDDDCRPRRDWLGALLAAWDGDATHLVGGHVENALTDNVYAAAGQALCDYLYAAGDAAGGGAEFFTSNNIGCARAQYLDLGGFDESFPLAAGEDRDFGRRWRDAGGDLRFAPTAVVDHAHPMALRGFWRQQSNYGRGARHLHAVEAQRKSGGKRFSAAGFYLGLIAQPLRDGRPRGVQRAALLALAQLATAWGYAHEGMSRRHAAPLAGRAGNGGLRKPASPS